VRRIILGFAALASVAVCLAQTPAEAIQFSGQVRLQGLGQQASSTGPLAQADALQKGIVELPSNGGALEAELRASGHGLSSVVTLQQPWSSGGATSSKAWVNELYASHDGGAWQFSAGKKIVAWDVGYGFRPNDVIQQEARRTLISSTPEGRPLLMAEYFNASTAWSWVWVNPTASSDALGSAEPALALRVYQRDGAVDWHGFARVGAHTGASVGAAAAWVANDALELHGSLRYLQRFDSLNNAASSSALVASNPWQSSTETGVRQILLGGTWTHESQLSLLAEGWWDGTAPSDAQWDAWMDRNGKLATLAAWGAPAAAVAGNLSWQMQAFSTSPSLRRGNVFLRLSWQHDAWQPALDILYTPTDRGRVVTASLSWQGDRVQLQGGLRAYDGPANAVLMQLPTRGIAYVASTWVF
jgi:hypothetical protein